MAAKHRKQDREFSRKNLVLIASLSAVAATAIITSGIATDGEPTPARQATSTSAHPQPLSQEGRLVAVSSTSVTAQSVDGFARTYLIDGQTNAITMDGSSIGGAGSTFSVNDEVAIVGVVRNGTAVATAVADKQVTNLNGPPMDTV